MSHFSTFMRAGLILMLLPLGAHAQRADESRLHAFTQTSFYTGLINRALVQIPPAIFHKCPGLVSNGSRIIVIRPTTFGMDGFPNSGLWKQTFPVSGCGNDTILNFYFSAGSDEKINTIVGMPGTTRADTLLQRDAFTYANIGATTTARSCRIFVVKNTQFDAFGLRNPPLPDPGPEQRLRPWRETWTLTGCGRTFDVPLDFVPDQTGTQIIQPGGTVEH